MVKRNKSVKNSLMSKNINDLIPFFLLAVAIIIVFMIISNFNYVIYAFGWTWNVIRPFLYGFIIAYLFNIPYGGIYHLINKIKFKFIKKNCKSISLIITYILIILFIVLFILFAMPSIVSAVSAFITSLPIYFQEAQQLLLNLNDFEFFGYHVSIEDLLATIGEMIQNLSMDYMGSWLNTLLTVPAALFNAFIAIISSIFMMVEKDKFIGFMRRATRVITPGSVNELITKYASMLNENLKKYLYVQTIYGLICGVSGGIILALMGSPFAIVLGIILGLCNYIPYLGSWVASIIVVIVVWFSQGFEYAIAATLIVFAYQQVTGYVLYPLLMGKSFKFSPLLVTISVVIGGAIAGVFGMIIAIPFAIIIKDMVLDIIAYIETKRKLVGEQKRRASDVVD